MLEALQNLAVDAVIIFTLMSIPVAMGLGFAMVSDFFKTLLS